MNNPINFASWLQTQPVTVNDFGNRTIVVPFYKRTANGKCGICKRKEVTGGVGWLGFSVEHCGGKCYELALSLQTTYNNEMAIRGISNKNKGGNMPNNEKTIKTTVAAPKKVAGLKAFDDGGFEQPTIHKKELKPLHENEAQGFTQIMTTKGLKVERMEFQNKTKKSITIDPVLWNVYENRAKQDGGAVSKIIEKALLEALEIPNLQALYMKVKNK